MSTSDDGDGELDSDYVPEEATDVTETLQPNDHLFSYFFKDF